MKYSICLSTNPAKFDAVPFKGNFKENVHYIKELGFDGVELAIRDPEIIDQGELYAILEEADMEVSAIGTGQAWGEERLSLTDPDPLVREKIVKRIYSHIPFASRTGGIIIIGLVRGIGNPDIPRSTLEQWLYEGFSRCCEEADKHHVRIAFEPINRYETTLLNNVESGLEFIEKVGGENLGMLLDTFHMNIEEPSIEQSILQAGSRMFHFHYADSNRLYPGCGHIDFRSLLQTVMKSKYTGYISGEHRPDPDPAISAREGLRHLKNIEADIKRT